MKGTSWKRKAMEGQEFPFGFKMYVNKNSIFITFPLVSKQPSVTIIGSRLFKSDLSALSMEVSLNPSANCFNYIFNKHTVQ